MHGPNGLTEEYNIGCNGIPIGIITGQLPIVGITIPLA